MQPVRTNRITDSAEFARVFAVSRETVARLETYARLLRTWQKTINLVAPSTLDDLWHRHFADSAQVMRVWDEVTGRIAASTLKSPPPWPSPTREEGAGPLGAHRTRGGPAAPLRWADLGSGAGFPGLIVGILWAEWGGMHLQLVDSDQRKAAFLREVVRETGLKAHITVDIIASRIESSANHSTVQLFAPADVVSARALAPLPRLLDWARPSFGPDTVGIFLKGREAEAEIQSVLSSAGWSFETRPSLTEADARVVVVRRAASPC